jgi:hypothetical protein
MSGGVKVGVLEILPVELESLIESGFRKFVKDPPRKGSNSVRPRWSRNPLLLFASLPGKVFESTELAPV